MKRWPTMRVEEVCSLVRGSSPRPKSDPRYYGGPIPRLTIADITRDGWSVTPRLDSLTKLGATMSRPIKAGTIVMAVSGNVGLCAELAVDACIHDGFVAFKDLREDLFMPSFFGLAMSQMGETHERNKAGAVFQNITTSDVKAMPIPMPSLVEQGRIMKLLDEADALKKLRAKADRRTAELIPSLFHEMFGDPVTNPKRWPSKHLGEAAIINPKLPRQKLPPAEKEFSFVPMAAVDEILGIISPHETRKYCEVAKGYTPFQSGDVLFAKITPCMQNGKSAIAENLVGGLGFGSTEFHVLRPTEIIISDYIFWLIRRPSFRNQAEQNFTGTGGQQRVPTNFMENYPCPIPPLPLQKEFAQRVAEIRELEAGQAASRRRLEELFQSLLHRAFNGEL